MQGRRFNDLFKLYLCLTNSWEGAVVIIDIQLENYVSLFNLLEYFKMSKLCEILKCQVSENFMCHTESLSLSRDF